MCGRYRLSRPEKLAETFEAAPFEDLPPRYNIAPTQTVAIAAPPLRSLSARLWAEQQLGLWSATAVIHELGHYFGMDEEQLKGLGNALSGN
jgi:putative SOS response-associated peptidase YedK